ncbi:MAG: ATP-binding cassette domain-containing protein [Anaerolineae bacterium]|nr:ATP-binding cassette domain-containing protein [Anaerolineae bacterium]MCO5191745.1 ATP-binding cassette domain-containing protein [Anaerolineae bacterium]MCO5206279.1 ATP-binding cassette domain-containing protein [Anaerolineae bacterium]
MSNREITVENLVKSYPGGVTAIDDISFHVNAGDVFGFLGPNGAGKSTTIKILTTLGLPTSGSATVGGYDIISEAGQVRRIAGVALQDIGIDPLMKPLELLTLQAQMFGESRKAAQLRANELLELVDLTEAVDRRVGTYSGGMRRRLDLALALVHDPDILFLDEPTTGLDPASRRDVWTEVRRLNRELGMTIFLTTQYLEEADELADTIAIINKGKLAIQGAPARLKAEMGTESINLAFDDRASAELAADELTDMAERIQIDRSTVRLYRNQAAESIPAVINRLREANNSPISLTLTQPALDDVFLKVTGERLEAEKSAELQPA